jgi:protein AbiQ
VGTEKGKAGSTLSLSSTRRLVVGEKLNFYIVNSGYCDFLREADYRVPYNKDSKQGRPFVGIVFAIKNTDYYAPLTSPRQKHKHMRNSADFLKIKDGKYGAINFNNMIPVVNECLSVVHMKAEKDDTPDKVKYKTLLNNQLTWCNVNKDIILKRAMTLYSLIVKEDGSDKLRARCCDFKLLESKVAEWKQKK